MRHAVLTLLVVVVAAAAPSTEAPQTLAVAGRSSAFPSVAAMGSLVAVAWGATAADGGTDVYVAVSRDGGHRFGPPLRANDLGSRANLAGEQPPRVALVPRRALDPVLVVVWTSKTTAGTRLVFAQSTDFGRAFSRPTIVPGSDAAGNRGWQAVATDDRGELIVVWLDHRDTASSSGRPSAGASSGAHVHHAAGSPEDATARAQPSKLFFARLNDATSGHAVAAGVCYCCRTAVATAAGGMIYAAWRHVFSGSVRDIAVSVSGDRGHTFSAPARVSEDGWVLNGCPENGPAIAVGPSGVAHVVWPTVVPGATPRSEGDMALFHATSRDGRRFTPRRRLATRGVPRHVTLAVDATGTLVAAWEEQAEGTRRVVLGVVPEEPARATGLERRVVSGQGPATYPSIAPTSGGVVVAWTSGISGSSVVRVDIVRP